MDISIYDNYSGVNRDFNFFQIDGEYKMCDSFLTILCMRGRARFRIRLHDIEIKRGSYLVIGSNDPFYIVESSEDFHIDVVRVGESVFSLSYDEVLKNRLERLTANNPTSKISERKTMMFHIIHSYLKVLMKERHDFYRDMIIYEYVKIFLYEACHILDDTHSISNLGKKDRSITSQFFQMVDIFQFFQMTAHCKIHQQFFQSLLDSGGIFLDLPSMVGRSVIHQMKGYVSHYGLPIWFFRSLTAQNGPG